ncbi:DUF2791 family P-loop domain-containing protein [Microcoleus sp. T2B6]|uniref:BREX system ATP-binding domain-containing protein n=1 Tax=Microcoleus sp. T2B6 TaxID=3055424 RepID=UPI002FD117C7
MEQHIATQVVESLRKGTPPQRGVDLYSVGNEKLIAGIKKFHLSGIEEKGLIRFLSGSWGAGKTHFFRLLREVAFQNNCLVSNVQLDQAAALNKFESVFYSILQNISTASYLTETEAAPFGQVLKESLAYLSTGNREVSNEVSYEDYVKAREALILDRSIDIDFKKMIQKYWETFLPDSPDLALQEKNRGEILEWFSGKGSVAMYRKRFEVNKIVNKDNAKLMLQSLAGFVRLSGYKGLLILFDEAEQSYSIMRKSSLRDAHNNLLSLINNIEALKGLFLIYATTPDFFSDPRHGIITYGALSGRIGEPKKEGQPRALDTIWNFDQVVTDLSDYQTAAKKILSIYATAYPEGARELPSEAKVENFVKELYDQPSVSFFSFWRVLVIALIIHFDDHLEGEIRSAETLCDDVMARAREE